MTHPLKKPVSVRTTIAIPRDPTKPKTIDKTTMLAKAIKITGFRPYRSANKPHPYELIARPAMIALQTNCIYSFN